MVLDERVRLSRSAIWGLQRAFFEQMGVDAWRKGIVPHYITSNGFIARAYARVIYAFLKDRRAPPPSADGLPSAAGLPIHIVELGTGSGRFTYALLRHLEELIEQSAYPLPPFRYVMTDLPERNLDFWLDHPFLQEWLQSGLLDVAQFDAEHSTQLTLRRSGVVLEPGKQTMPMVVIANYFFDSIPQDAFYVKGGALQEALLTTTLPDNAATLAPDERIKQAKIDYSPAPVVNPAYANEALNAVLESYAATLPETVVTIPTAAVWCVDFFRRLSGDHLLLLSGDKGQATLTSLQGRTVPALVSHGSFSLNVNFHALGEYIRHLGGQMWHADPSGSTLSVAAFACYAGGEGSPQTSDSTGDPIERTPTTAQTVARAFAETQEAFERELVQFGAGAFFTLKKALETHHAKLSAAELLAALKLSGSDPSFVQTCLKALQKGVGDLSNIDKRHLKRLLIKGWTLFFPLGNDTDLAFDIGRVLYELNEFREASRFFQRSLDVWGPDAATTYNMALCHSLLHEPATALSWARQTLEINPAHEGARAMRLELEEKLQGG